MKALVTGGHGFIGSFLVEKLLKEGWSVRCLVRPTSNLQWIKNLSVDTVVGDVTQQETLPAAVKDVDMVFHIAGALKGTTRDKFFSVNCQGTLNLAQAVAQGVSADTFKRFIFVSSLTATGPADGTNCPSEESPCNPVSDYGFSKLAAERALKEKFPEMPLTVIRPPIVYGPRDSNFLQFFKCGKMGFFPLPSSKEMYFSIVHVKDLVEGIYQSAISEKAQGETYFISNPETYSAADLAIEIARPFGKKPFVFEIPRLLVRALAWGGDIYSWLTKNDVMFTSKKVPEFNASWTCSPKKSENHFNFKTQVPLSVGIKETADWLKAHHYL